ncbi:protein phosphatase inhibitor 2, putative [Plasmodium berghei]|uniref:Protein phosphatase inhibitor 2, putative n=3 Tax=Plasmodium berghei TaxID=5821 RepID=A0A509ALX0_PLABA|nr:protein phosphatase inhibitor 2, putative [Plasmodium berghei ANKA]CXI76964.1 protein phosphatase inhibitor 2, putative [Plasmodium berghei]VUC57084.1 protein phosphatase inhibitor 2, putative [Plasmodium berghei ANKA]|eukprot:XP_034422863.1 protein phosphatase inhibitor 2, putative [Plasmodium berghei ANKA]
MKKKINKIAAKKTISWDEVTINEQDKERGSRMKILEPNTPFNFIVMDSASEDETSKIGDSKTNSEGQDNIADDLINKLNQLVEKQDCKGVSNIDFKEKRKKHYNEYKILQKLRKSGTFDEIDEEYKLENNESNDDNNNAQDGEE